MEVLIKALKNDKIKDCFLSEHVFKSLNLNEDTKYELFFGQLKYEVKIKCNKNEEKSFLIPEKIIKKMYLSEKNLRIWRKNSKIYLGPVVGIFINTKKINRLKNNRSALGMKKHYKASESAYSLGYYFSINDIDWINKRINGFYLDAKDNLWKQKWMPLPNVIYDRGTLFKKKNKPLVKFIRKQFNKDKNIHFINDCQAMGKWSLYKKLSKYESLKQYLPDTRIYSSFKDLSNMLKVYDEVFVKPFYGNRGEKIIKVNKEGQYYKIKYYKPREIIQYKYTSLKELKKFIDKTVNKNKTVIQQGISLSLYKGNRFDLRMFMIKGEQGEWNCESIKVRWDKDSKGITNISMGGKIVSYRTLLETVEKNHYPSTKTLKDFAVNVASHLELEYGNCGELGLDIGIDANGKLWFIEANTKPDKKRGIPGEVINNESNRYINIFKYAYFLTQGDGGNGIV